MPTHEELAAFLRQFAKLPEAVRSSFITTVIGVLVDDLGDRGFDPTAVRSRLRLHKLSGTDGAWLVSFAGQYRAVFRLGKPRVPGHAHLVWEFVGLHDDYE